MASFLLVGDAPSTHSGLARIAKDIAQHLVRDGHSVDFLGLQHQWNWTAKTDPGYPIWAIRDGEEFGERDVLEHVYRLTNPRTVADNEYDKPLIVWFIWDPSRCASPIAAIRAQQKRGNFKNVQIWGYYAVDAEGPGKNRAFGGPAAMAVQETDRVLAYTEFGARVLCATDGPNRSESQFPHLPHGLSAPFVGDPSIESAIAAGKLTVLDKPVAQWVRQHHGRILGAVATNQPRKDLPLLFEAGALARESGLIDALWLHTDLLTGHYSLPWIVENWGWIGGKNLLITTPKGVFDKKTGFGSRWTLESDEQLAAMYQACRVTFAPGLGEGWGYPIVESMALGIPCVVVDYAGGAELIPPDWCVPVEAWRWDGLYCLRRPVMRAGDVYNALTRAVSDHETPEEYRLNTATRELGQKWAWSRIWPELWKPWIEEGLR